MSVKEKCAGYGVTLGAALAVSMSWSLHHNVILAVVHGWMSWFYVVAWMIS